MTDAELLDGVQKLMREQRLFLVVESADDASKKSIVYDGRALGAVLRVEDLRQCLGEWVTKGGLVQ